MLIRLRDMKIYFKPVTSGIGSHLEKSKLQLVVVAQETSYDVGGEQPHYLTQCSSHHAIMALFNDV